MIPPGNGFTDLLTRYAIVTTLSETVFLLTSIKSLPRQL